MQNIVILLTLLLLPWWLLGFAGVSESLRGRVGLSLVFAFTGLGHFIKTAAMAQMLPPAIPARLALIQASGVLELLAAAALLVPAVSRPAGILICVFLLVVLPVNLYAAWHRVDFGGHGAGPVYLLLRVPLQFFLLGWAWWFAVRTP
jgi:uncharacterized membrane protein